jgi:hypothetical protein
MISASEEAWCRQRQEDGQITKARTCCTSDAQALQKKRNSLIIRSPYDPEAESGKKRDTRQHRT